MVQLRRQALDSRRKYPSPTESNTGPRDDAQAQHPAPLSFD